MKFWLLFIAGFFSTLSLTPVMAVETTPRLPVSVLDEDWNPLTNMSDFQLQEALAQQLKTYPRWAGLIANEKLAIALVDLSDPSEPRFAHINGDVMMYAASLPKIAILLAAVDALEKGRLKLDAALDQDLADMIRTSSNVAATRVIDRLGGLDQVNRVLTDPAYKFYDEELGGGLWMGRRYAKKSRRIPDPMNGISHGANAMQVARFYYRMATGRIINNRASSRMLYYMVDPGINHKFVNSLSKSAPDARLYRKSGTWKYWHSDSVLVWGPRWRRYILVGMVEDSRGEEVLRALVPLAENALRKEYRKPKKVVKTTLDQRPDEEYTAKTYPVADY